MLRFINNYLAFGNPFINSQPDAAENGTPQNSRENNSLMHLIYQRKVNDGLIAADANCANCICFGDEWPL